jgi:LacI family transcriptional regulator
MAKPTMADVAARAGVTVATVSRALRTDTAHELKAETVARVRRAAEQLGYRPNRLARALRTQRSQIVGIVVPDLTNPFMPSVIAGLEDALGAAGVAPLVMNTDNDPEREARAVDALLDHQVDGLVLSSARLDDGWAGLTWAASVPLVLMNRRSAHALPAVIPDDVQGVRDVALHLVGLGHRRIVHLAGPEDLGSTRDRESGFVTFVRDAGAEVTTVLRASRLTIDEGVRLCRELLHDGTDATAVFAANDMLAMGCLQVLREHGVAVPAQMSVVGFNDVVAADMLQPPLTTVRIPQRDLGRRAGELILELLAGEGDRYPSEPVRLPCELMVRGSTAPPPDVSALDGAVRQSYGSLA